MEEKMELEFSKFNLQPEDILVVKVDTNGLNESESIKKVSSLREDEFIKYIEAKGNKVFVSYTGLDFQILRMEETDKVVAYIDVSSLEEENAEKYVNYVKFKLGESLQDRLICVPVKNGSPQLRVEKGDKIDV